MEFQTVYEKKLCMTEMQTEHAYFQHTRFFDTAEGNINSSFVYIKQGTATVKALGLHLFLEQGSLFYIPEAQHYHMIWNGEPDIEYYCFHIISKKFDISKVDRHSIQRIDALSTPQTGDLFQTIFQKFATGERLEKVRAIGMYYAFYADVLPHLREAPPMQYHEALLGAISYIDQHWNEDISVESLASAVCVSPSRIYHLFKKELGTTPVKYRNELRIEHASQDLRKTEDSVEQISETNGFHSPVYFRELFKEFTGLTPSEYRSIVRKPESR